MTQTIFLNTFSIIAYVLIAIILFYHIKRAHKLGCLFYISDYLIMREFIKNAFYVKLHSSFGQRMMTINDRNILICRLKPNVYQGFIRGIHRNYVKVGEAKSIRELLLLEMPDLNNSPIKISKLNFGQYIDFNRTHFNPAMDGIYEKITSENKDHYQSAIVPLLNA